MTEKKPVKVEIPMDVVMSVMQQTLGEKDMEILSLKAQILHMEKQANGKV
jgi:hypothetical protein